MNAYRGTNIEQDGRFGNKEKQLLKTMRFDKALDTKVDIKKVQIDVVKPWITKKLTAMLGIEDDVVAEFVFAQLEEKDLNPKRLQINITGFLNARRAREFVSELWTLLVEAQESPDGIPESLITKKMEELKAASNRREMPMARATESDWKHRYQTITGGRYGREAPNYASEPGAGDDVNREPESPSNRRWKREPTPDIPIPRRKRGDAENSDRPERSDRPDRSDRPARDHEDRRRGRDREDDRDRRRRRDSSGDRVERRRRRRSPSPSPRPERRRRRSPSSSPERRRRRQRSRSRSSSRDRRTRRYRRRSSTPVSPPRRTREDRPTREERPAKRSSSPEKEFSLVVPKKSHKHHDSDSSPDAKRSKKEKKQKKEKKKKRDHDEEDD